MKRKLREPYIPVARRETIRQRIMSFLECNTLSAKDISVDAGISEKEVYEHLEHIQKTLNKSNHVFAVMPAVCKKCNFVFRKRDKLKKPGRCPVCHGELIREPRFSISKTKPLL
jgi:predicted Zn-ribbon and HTH transcriptional regulator